MSTTVKDEEQQYLQKYYSTLVGMTITGISIVNDLSDGGFGDNWLVINAKTADGKRFRLEVSQDPEGNGPGFIFGLPIPSK